MPRRIMLALTVLLILFSIFTSVSTATREDIPPFMIIQSNLLECEVDGFMLDFYEVTYDAYNSGY